MKEEDKDLNYWKENAKDAYMTTPICVLRYITELEKAVENNIVLPIPNARKSFTPDFIVKVLEEDCNTLDDAITMFKEQI